VGRERDLRGGVGATQAALAVLVVAGVAVGALLLRAGGTGWGKGTGPIGGHSSVVVLLALAWAAGGLALSSRYGRRMAHDRELSPVEERLAGAMRYALVLLALAVPLLVLGLHRFATRPRHHAAGNRRIRPPAKQLPGRLPRTTISRQWDVSLLLDILLGIGIALLVAVVVIAAVFLWRRLHLATEPAPEATYGTTDEQRRLAEAVDSGRRALLGGDDARAAVIACYAAMEESLAASGVARRASDSPQDLLERAATSGLLTSGGAPALTELFREARYSTHPMDGGHRDRAAAALTEIAAGLDAHRAAETAGVPATAEAAS
jgi:hypothetical protein